MRLSILPILSLLLSASLDCRTVEGEHPAAPTAATVSELESEERIIIDVTRRVSPAVVSVVASSGADS